MKKHKVIIDTDAGVDDITALTFVLHDPEFEIELITISSGNIKMEHAVRNACHLLDIFEKDVPIVEGYSHRMGGTDEFAYHVHGREGFGLYVPPKTTQRKPLKVDCADAMYEIFKKYPKQVTIVILGPHTNFAHMLKKYPDASRYVKDVVMMGGSLSGIRNNPEHRSFNIRTDAEAFKYTVDSQLNVVMCPSRIGRDVTYFSEEQVKQIGETNEVGKFLEIVFQTYWEPDYPEKILSNCDLAAIYYITHPEFYKTKNAFIDVDTEVNIGTTVGHYDRKGYFTVVQTVNREKFQDMIFKKLNEMSSLKITNKDFHDNIKGKYLDEERTAFEKEFNPNNSTSKKNSVQKKISTKSKTASVTKSKAVTKNKIAKSSSSTKPKTTTKTKEKSVAQAKQTKTSPKTKAKTKTKPTTQAKKPQAKKVKKEIE